MEKGFNNTGIQEVLSAVNVPKGSFYHYFKSKEDFGICVLEHYAEASIEMTRSVLGDTNISPLQRLKNFFDFSRQKMAANQYCGGCLFGNLSQEMGDQSPAFETLLEKKWQLMRVGFMNCIEEGRNLGEIPPGLPAEVLADFMINSWQGALLRMKVSKSPQPMDVFTKAVFERLVA